MRRAGLSVAERNHAATHIELIVRFALWADALRTPPCAQQIADHFDVSRATAFRWRQYYLAAIGLPSRPEPKTTHRLAATGSAFNTSHEAHP